MAAKSDALQDDSDVYTLTDSSAFLEFLPADEKTRETFREKTAIDQIKPVRILDNPIKEKFFKGTIER